MIAPVKKIKRMYKHILEQAGQVNWMAIAALLTFVTVFVVSAVLIFKKDRAFIDRMAAMPLDESDYPTYETTQQYEQ